MNDNGRHYTPGEELPKVEWVVHKLPIKSGSVIRAAIHRELYFQAVPWSIIEGVVLA